MSASPCEAQVRVVDDTAVVDLSGDINRDSDATLTSAYNEASRMSSTILLNFTDTGYINSTGIAVIVGILARSRADGKEVRACGLSDHYKEIFEITRLSDFMTIFSDETSAVGGTPTPA